MNVKIARLKQTIGLKKDKNRSSGSLERASFKDTDLNTIYEDNTSLKKEAKESDIALRNIASLQKNKGIDKKIKGSVNIKYKILINRILIY